MRLDVLNNIYINNCDPYSCVTDFHLNPITVHINTNDYID